MGRRDEVFAAPTGPPYYTIRITHEVVVRSDVSALAAVEIVRARLFETSDDRVRSKTATLPHWEKT